MANSYKYNIVANEDECTRHIFWFNACMCSSTLWIVQYAYYSLSAGAYFYISTLADVGYHFNAIAWIYILIHISIMT